MQSPDDGAVAAQGRSSGEKPTPSGVPVPQSSTRKVTRRRSNAYGEILDRLVDDLDDH